MPLKSSACCHPSSPRLLCGCRYSLVWRNLFQDKPKEFGFCRCQLNILILKDARNWTLYFFPKMTCCRLQNDENMVEFASTPQNCIFKDSHFTELGAIYTDNRLWLHAVWNVQVNLYLWQVNCRAGRSGIESRWGRDFPPVRTDPGAHPASCKMGTGSFPGAKCGRGALLTTHPLLVPRSWKSSATPLPTLWATPGL